ncbi:MAG: glycoside hydrolase family 76 protein [Vicinamibacteria bacterium]
MTAGADYLQAARQAASVLTTRWFTPDAPAQWVNDGDFWRTPNLATTLAILMKATGTTTWVETLKNAQQQGFYLYFQPDQQPADRCYPSFYDDEGWWGVGFVRAYELTGDASYLVSAQQVFADMQAGWDDNNRGGVWFRRWPKAYPGQSGHDGPAWCGAAGQPNFKGSIANGLYLDLAMRLYALGKDAGCLQAARAVTAWITASGLVDARGLFWGELDAAGKVNPDDPPRTYTQGVGLEAWWDLSAAGEAGAAEQARVLAEGAMAQMIWPGTQVLRELCEIDATCGPADNNPALFKGIYVRYLADLALRAAASGEPAWTAFAAKSAAFLRANADAVLASFPAGVFGIDWHTLQPGYDGIGDTLFDAMCQNSALDLFLAAAAVAAIE